MTFLRTFAAVLGQILRIRTWTITDIRRVLGHRFWATPRALMALQIRPCVGVGTAHLEKFGNLAPNWKASLHLAPNS
jgi:hypothetical protein